MNSSFSQRADVGIAPPGYRLPAATRLGPVRLQVSDLERSIAFYESIIGLRTIDRSHGSAVLGLQAGNDPLIELLERKGARPVRAHGRLGLYHVAIRLPDRPSLGRFIRHVAGQGIAVGSADHLVSEAIYLSDPDGLGLEVYCDRPRESWQYEQRQISMATNPLDVRSAVEAGGDGLWQGAPAGTGVGHMHLHVGDLAAAEDFYHRGLGFDKVVWSYPGALFMSAGGYHHHLGTNTWAAGAGPAGDDEAKLLEWTIVLPRTVDVTAASESLVDAGYAVAPDAGGYTAADPWGTTLRLVAES